MGVQRFTWIIASRLGRWPSLAPAKNNLMDRQRERKRRMRQLQDVYVHIKGTGLMEKTMEREKQRD